MKMSGVRGMRGNGRVVVALGAALAVSGMLAGCGSDGGSSATAPTTTATTTTTTATTTSAVAATEVSSARPASSPAAIPVTTVPVAPSTAAVAVRVPMPNVVCMNLQAAQDRIHEQGVFYSRSVDATGKARRQVMDANWVVVGQTPAAGVPIGEGDAVLSVVKIGEPSPC